ncbi:MAG: alanine--tRNA ligase [Candidatus Saccharimonadales bacterium]
MTAQEIRQAYLEFFKARGHSIIPRAQLVPQEDPTTLFTGSGMQPLIPYLLGEPNPNGTRLTDSQPCLRAQDIEGVGDNRHTTFFEMLGNWSLGDYFKPDQIPWLFEFLTEVVGLDPNKLYVSCYIGSSEFNVPKDDEAASLWQQQFANKGIKAETRDMGSEEEGYKKGMASARIFFYDGQKNWWSRAGDEASTPLGDPCGPDSEVFYDLGTKHDSKWGQNCHPNCDCGRFLEIANSVFMTYRRTDSGFVQLDKPNVDFGGGLERIAVAAIDDPDVYKISLLKPIVEKIEQISEKSYQQHPDSMRVITDHIRAATFLAVDGVVPSNKEQGYVMRRLIRRAVRYAFDLGVEQQFIEEVARVVTGIYGTDFPEVVKAEQTVVDILVKEERIFRQTLRKGLIQLSKMSATPPVTGEDLFKLQDTYGFPLELSLEEVFRQSIELEKDWRAKFDNLLNDQRNRSRTAAKGEFKGGLGGHSEMHKKYHTATHLMYESLRRVLGNHVIQHGSNITEERLRFDFSHPEKMTKEQIKAVEDMVNQQITKDLKVTYEEHPTKEALEDLHVLGAFGDRYGDSVKVYRMQATDEDKPFSLEICGGPHVEHTGQLAEGGKRFKIIREESSSAGIRRIKAVIQ